MNAIKNSKYSYWSDKTNRHWNECITFSEKVISKKVQSISVVFAALYLYPCRRTTSCLKIIAQQPQSPGQQWQEQQQQLRFAKLAAPDATQQPLDPLDPTDRGRAYPCLPWWQSYHEPILQHWPATDIKFAATTGINLLCNHCNECNPRRLRSPPSPGPLAQEPELNSLWCWDRSQRRHHRLVVAFGTIADASLPSLPQFGPKWQQITL